MIHCDNAAESMTCRHERVGRIFFTDDSFENLLVGQHPKSSKHVKQGRNFQKPNSICGQLVIHHWWFLKCVGNVVAFKHPQDNKIEACNGEKYWNADTVHHSNERHIQDVAVLEVDDEFGSKVNIEVLVNLGCFGVVFVALEIFVAFLLKPCNPGGDRLDEHGH